MSNEIMQTITNGVNWFFNTAASLGTIQHMTYVWIDAALVGVGLLSARPAGKGARRMYSEVKRVKARLEKR